MSAAPKIMDLFRHINRFDAGAQHCTVQEGLALGLGIHGSLEGIMGIISRII